MCHVGDLAFHKKSWGLRLGGQDPLQGTHPAEPHSVWIGYVILMDSVVKLYSLPNCFFLIQVYDQCSPKAAATTGDRLVSELFP